MKQCDIRSCDGGQDEDKDDEDDDGEVTVEQPDAQRWCHSNLKPFRKTSPAFSC